ncbi:MAG: FAD-binding oxidoreductase [Microcystaceae cyanobacterium]
MEIQPWEQLNPDYQQTITNAIKSDRLPLDLIAPSEVAQLTEILQESAQQKYKLLAMGAGSKLNWGGLVSHCDRVISTRNLNQLLDHAISDLTVTVEAGVKLTDLQAILKPHRQFLPIDPAYPEQSTVGGIMATADAGSWRQRYGGLRDLVLGFSFVRWDGQIAKAGSKVVKNVAGYDLMKLFTGSYGTLGIITQITFRLYPLPEMSQTLWFSGEVEKIALLAQNLRRSGLAPTRADILSSKVAKSLELGENLGLLVRFQNIPESVSEQVEQLISMARAIALTHTDFTEEKEANLWQSLQNQMTVPPTSESITCKIGIKPDQAISFLAQSTDLAQIHLNTGLGRLNLTFADGNKTISYLSQQRQLCQKNQGFLSVLAAPKYLKQQFDPWGYNGNSLDLMKKIKQQFDPHNLLNPGRFVGDI